MKRFPQAAFLAATCFFCLLSMVSCTSSRNYEQYLSFQNAKDSLAAALKETVIQPNDLLSIQVLSKSINQEQTALFNLFNVGISAANSNTSEKQLPIGYQVSAAGNIEVPLIGEVKAAGLTKRQLQNALAQKLAPYVKDPMVNIRFLQYNVNVLGEVKQPGIKSFPVDRVTIVDALSAAGDVGDYGRRDNIMVIREENGQRKHYIIDMTDSRKLFASPAYQLQANDIVYVSPAKNKLRNLERNPDTEQRIGLLFSFISAATFLGNLIINLK